MLLRLVNYTEISFWYVVALNEALKKEVERLKVATGEMMSHTDSFNLGMHLMPFSGSNFVPIPPQSGPSGHQNMQMPPFGLTPSTMPSHLLHQTSSHPYSEILQNDQLGRFQGLDISSKGSTLVKSEGPSLSASESSTTFWIWQKMLDLLTYPCHSLFIGLTFSQLMKVPYFMIQIWGLILTIYSKGVLTKKGKHPWGFVAKFT